MRRRKSEMKEKEGVGTKVVGVDRRGLEQDMTSTPTVPIPSMSVVSCKWRTHP